MKKLFLFSSAALLSGSLYWFCPHPAIHPFPSKLRFEIVYKASIGRLPPAAENIKIWIPVASTREGQTILERRIQSSKPYQVSREPVYGNEMAYLEMKKPFPDSLDIEVIYTAEVSRAFYEEGNGEKNPEKYLQPSTLMVVNDTIRTRTRDAIRGKGSLREKARGIYEDVIRRMRYDKSLPGWGRGDAVRACLLGKGNCTDFHSLFISMAHAAEIPARFKIGLTLPQTREGDIPGYHCWAEFYEEGKGWRPVDASEAWKNPERKEAYFGNFDTHKFLISVGRDVELVPRQTGPPVNIFFYPYVEVDGKDWAGVQTSFRFKNLEV